MANATDIFEDAEQLIRNIVFDRNVGKALEICRWLFSFNGKEKHKIKCYQTFGENPDIRFCFDRGSDCEKTKIMTCFLVIEPSFTIDGLFSKNPTEYPYFKPSTTTRWRINSGNSIELTPDVLRSHIFESYQVLLNKTRFK